MQKIEYKVVKKVRETPDVVTLHLTCHAGSPTYIPGQFITVYFPDTGTPEGKSYSISSTSTEPTLNITVKAMGEFSNRLNSLDCGDTVHGSEPYGFFFSEYSESTLVLVAGGIGVAPFRSMILESLAKDPMRKIILHHSVRVASDRIFYDEFRALLNSNPSFSLHYHLTRTGASPRRIEPQDILLDLEKEKTHEFFLCGSISFVRDLWKGLRENGVPEDIIYTEAFFSH